MPSDIGARCLCCRLHSWPTVLFTLAAAVFALVLLASLLGVLFQR